MKEELWALEWSNAQRSVHVDHVTRMIENNQRNMVTDAKVDWVPVMIGTEEQCRSFAREIQARRDLSEL